MIYFVRHGESEANALGIFSGSRIDAPLTLNGQQQAELAGEQLAVMVGHIDRVYASTLQRSQQTATIMARKLAFNPDQIQIDRRIIEYDLGDLSGTPTNTISPKLISSARGAEDPGEFYKRIMSFFNEIKDLPGVSLVVGHAWIERMLVAHERSWPPEDFYKVEPPANAEIIAITP